MGTSRERRETMIGLASSQMLVQLSSMPIAMTIPSVARDFDIEVSKAAWMVIVRLLMLGSTVFLSARLGEKYGHARVHFIGIIVLSVASVLAATSFDFNQLILWSGLVGVGGALITANSNAILTMAFDDKERGRAFSVPVVSARMGSLLGLVVFGIFLQFLNWRFVFLTSLPVGLLAVKNSYPLLKYQAAQLTESARNISINYVGAILMVVTLGTFVLSGLHIHGGEETFTSEEAISYHVPMHILFLSLLALFIVVQHRTKEPFLDFRYFKYKYFSTALYTNTTFHLSMLAVVTLIPIVVENGLGKAPIFVTLVLLPNQILGLFLPTFAGWWYDRYNPRWLRPGALMGIALGFLLVGAFASTVSWWGIPLLLLPTYIGSNLFNTANNAVVMNTLPESRTFASGMLETTRQMGHTIGTTISATVLGLALPFAIDLLPVAESQLAYRDGFRFSALAVVLIMMSGSFMAAFQRSSAQRQEQRTAAPQGAGDG
ncbi:MAG: MFS transporter [Dehalococcoidia bacterium]